MKNIAIQFATIILLCPYLHFPSQAQNFDPERESDREDIEVTSEEEEEKEPTRSYLGLGGTIGISGDATPLGDDGFSLIGRSAFTDKFSLHTSNLFQDDGLSLFSLTLGFPIGNSSSERELLFPFAGAGIAIEDFFGDFGVDPLVTAGVDIPIGKKFVGTARVNITFPENDTDIGLLLGIGYNFSIADLF